MIGECRLSLILYFIEVFEIRLNINKLLTNILLPNFVMAQGQISSIFTAITIPSGDVASLKFVSTLQEYRRRKAFITLNSHALAELFVNGMRAVSLVSLRGPGEAVALYEKLEFHECIKNIIM